MTGVSLGVDLKCRSFGFVDHPPRLYGRTAKTCIKKRAINILTVNDLCVNGGVLTDFIEPKTGTTVTINGDTVANGDVSIVGELKIDQISPQTVTSPAGPITVNADLCVTGTVQTDTVEAKTPGAAICIVATGSPANSELNVDVIDEKTASNSVRFPSGMRYLSTGALTAYPTELNYFEEFSGTLDFTSDVFGAALMTVTYYVQRLGNFAKLYLEGTTLTMAGGSANDTIFTDVGSVLPARFRPVSNFWDISPVIDGGLVPAAIVGFINVQTSGAIVFSVGTSDADVNDPTTQTPFTFLISQASGIPSQCVEYRI